MIKQVILILLSGYDEMRISITSARKGVQIAQNRLQVSHVRIATITRKGVTTGIVVQIAAVLDYGMLIELILPFP